MSESGTYYIKVGGVATSSVPGSNGAYTLKATTSADASGIEFEPNDVLSSAQTLSSGSALQGTIASGTDVDWYSIEASSSGTLTVNFDVSEYDYYGWGGDIQDSSGNILGSFECEGYECRDDGVSTSVGLRESGTYYIKIGSGATSYAPGSNGAYALKATLE